MKVLCRFSIVILVPSYCELVVIRNCLYYNINCTIIQFLPPAYVVRREGNSFTLFVSPHLGGGGSADRGGSGPATGGGGGGVRSSHRRGGGSGPAGGGVSGPAGGGSASCALLRAVCLLRSRRRTFLFIHENSFFHKMAGNRSNT